MQRTERGPNESIGQMGGVRQEKSLVWAHYLPFITLILEKNLNQTKTKKQ